MHATVKAERGRVRTRPNVFIAALLSLAFMLASAVILFQTWARGGPTGFGFIHDSVSRPLAKAGPYEPHIISVNVWRPPSAKPGPVFAIAARGFRSRLKPQQGEPIILKAMTFNIRHGLGRSGKVDLGAVAETIKAADPDIVALQEVDRFWPRSGFEDQTRVLAETLDYYAAFGANLKIGPTQYGNAILSRYPILSAQNLVMPSLREPRGCLGGTIILPGGNLLTVYSLHLGLEKSERAHHVRAMASYIRSSDTPVLVMGDYNTDPLGEEISVLREFLTDVYYVYERAGTVGGRTKTLSPIGAYRGSTFGLHRIDNIFSSDDIRAVWAGPIQTDASDHFPMMCEIQLGARPDGVASADGDGTR
ncbi:MAG TPA: hypothetical protein GX507_11450 [Clostridia bacterium]|nr:hypothetical protein [Clostridia bacterium]